MLVHYAQIRWSECSGGSGANDGRHPSGDVFDSSDLRPVHDAVMASIQPPEGEIVPRGYVSLRRKAIRHVRSGHKAGWNWFEIKAGGGDAWDHPREECANTGVPDGIEKLMMSWDIDQTAYESTRSKLIPGLIDEKRIFRSCRGKRIFGCVRAYAPKMRTLSRNSNEPKNENPFCGIIISTSHQITNGSLAAICLEWRFFSTPY
jgi:hypothetical protein